MSMWKIFKLLRGGTTMHFGETHSILSIIWALKKYDLFRSPRSKIGSPGFLGQGSNDQ